MKRFIAFFSSPFVFNIESCRLLNSYDDIKSAMSEMEIKHRINHTNDFKWEEESGFIFDLEENKYCKKEGAIWRDFLEIPDSFHEIINKTYN